ncbi:MAG: Foldase protein PrsA [Candidatus Magasanikbacteria bacterium GW2011_GWC2_45_8]|uniref:Foldase protein PrsA n=1 Tax=Candidatus Magasanikbacteria bacterium GW2011_GWC2_45_8 TaxID=1619050 RepID=A0A0G1Q912_9BACT|nr:MAG: Foldase protein PrsA [Candidatus Magasanikbacteria bacterium GW2011_GWC2_45_8]
MTENSQDFHIHATNELPTETPPEQSSNDPLQPSKNKAGVLLKGVFVGLIIVILASVGVWSYLIVRNNLTDNTSLRFARVVHLPAGFVNKTSIPYASYVEDFKAVKNFYESNKKKDPAIATPSDSELRKNVWDRLVRTALLGELASKNNAEVTSKDTDEEFKKLSTALGSEDAANKMIQESYGWSSAEFKQRVIMPFLLQQKVFSTTTTIDMMNTKARARAEEVLAKVKEGKEEFEDLAKQYSQDGSASQGGDLGWFDAETMVKPFSDAAFALKPGEISGIVQSQFGFHIIKLLEREEKKGKPARAHAEHILIRADADQFLGDLLKQSIIKLWVRIE